MPRLFTGLELPPEPAHEIAALRGGLPGARWLEPDDYHITLSFIGDIDGALARDLTQELGGVTASRFPVVVECLGAFGGSKPRAIIAHVALNDGLRHLHDEQERALRRVGIMPKRRKFAPHVTLARLKSASAYVVADFLSSRGCAPMRFEAARFVLYSARASVGGGPYVIEAAYPLD